MGHLQPALPLVPADPIDENPVTIEVDQGDGQEQRVPVELERGRGLAREAAKEVASPDWHHHHHPQPHNLSREGWQSWYRHMAQHIATKICTWEARKAGRRPLRSCSISSMLARLWNFQSEYYRDQVKRASICLCCCLWPSHWHWLWHNQSQSRAATATASDRALQRCTLLVQFSVNCYKCYSYENKRYYDDIICQDFLDSDMHL